ncbi:MAG TPA: proton-conducting transporter membrane subunit [Elusimicrobiota bacterium]|nr:proton-conducting transporter membrane subunit [Elusimicrobiota bacterium]
MSASRLLWTAALAALPGAVLAAYALGARGRRLYALAAAAAGLLTVVAAAPLALEFFRPMGSGPGNFFLLSTVLVPFAALLWLMTVVTTPSARLDDAGLARTAAACLLGMAAFLTAAPAALVLIWIATSAILAAGHLEPRFEAARRVIFSHLGLSTILLVAGAALAAWARGRGDAAPEQWGLALILSAVVVRKGIFPFHAWIPEIFDQGRIGPAVLFNAPQLGAYAALVLAVPYANPALLKTAAGLALVTAVYGSFMALYQADARRACGYLFVSQSALVIAGLELPGRGALVGALLLWVCSGVALAGLSRAVLALEARRGRLRLDVRHGGYERMPLLAVSFLIMGLAVANFPGTLGFIGGEMLARGAVNSFPGLGLFAVAAVAMSGLAAIRMYFSLFCGRKDSGAHLRMGRAESLGFAAAALVLLGFGLAPGGLTRVLSRASAALISSREVRSR